MGNSCLLLLCGSSIRTRSLSYNAGARGHKYEYPLPYTYSLATSVCQVWLQTWHVACDGSCNAAHRLLAYVSRTDTRANTIGYRYCKETGCIQRFTCIVTLKPLARKAKVTY